MSTLYRAFVYLPNHLRTPERSERTVFFEAPTHEHRYSRLAKLLALVWAVPEAAMLEEGVIYNVASEHELRDEYGHVASGDLSLLEIGSGGTEGGVFPPCPMYAGVSEADIDAHIRANGLLRIPENRAVVRNQLASSGQGTQPLRVSFARAADVDLLVSPRAAARLQAALREVETLYANAAGPAVGSPGRRADHDNHKQAGRITVDGCFATLVLTCLVAAALCWLGPIHLDGGPSYSSYGYTSPTAGEIAAAESRRADIVLCQQLHNENATAVQLPDGQHRCADKHGRRLSNRSAIVVMHEVQP